MRAMFDCIHACMYVCMHVAEELHRQEITQPCTRNACTIVRNYYYYALTPLVLHGPLNIFLVAWESPCGEGTLHMQ